MGGEWGRGGKEGEGFGELGGVLAVFQGEVEEAYCEYHQNWEYYWSENDVENVQWGFCMNLSKLEQSHKHSVAVNNPNGIMY